MAPKHISFECSIETSTLYFTRTGYYNDAAPVGHESYTRYHSKCPFNHYAMRANAEQYTPDTKPIITLDTPKILWNCYRIRSAMRRVAYRHGLKFSPSTISLQACSAASCIFNLPHKI